MMVGLKKYIHGIRLAGFLNTTRALRNKFYRQHVDRKFLKPLPPSFKQSPHSPGKITSIKKTSAGAFIEFERSSLRVIFLMDDFLFLGWHGAEMQPSYAVERFEWSEDCADKSINIEELITGCRSQAIIASEKVRVEIMDDFLD